MNRHKVFHSRLGQNYYDAIERGIEWIGIGSNLAGGLEFRSSRILPFRLFVRVL